MAQLDVLMVTPSSRGQVYQTLSQDYAAIEPPVWSGLIAQFLRARGYAVAILDAEALGLSPDDTAKRIADADPALIVYVIYGQQPSASTQCMPAGGKVAAKTNALTDRPSLVIGTHASALPERTQQEEPYTYVCNGEGPYTALGLIEHLKGTRALTDVPGLVYRDDGRIVSNGHSDNIKDLDTELPTQAWDLLEMGLYRPHNWQTLTDPKTHHGYASIQTSLGCPYRCTFCCINAPFGAASIRYWKPETIVRQIDHVVQTYGITTIKIPDEMFLLNKNHVLGICDLLIDRKYDLNIWAYARVDTVHPVFLAKLREAGFQWLGIGIESGSKYVRDGTAKGRFGNEDIKRTLGILRDAGINVSANYIFGLPDDDMETMAATFDMAIELRTEWVNLYSAMAYPGSALYRMAKERGWLVPDDPGGPGWIGYSQHAYETLPLQTQGLDGTQVLDYRDQAFHRYFTDPDYLSLVRKRFGADAVEHIQQMGQITLRRRHHDFPGYYKELQGLRHASSAPASSPGVWDLRQG